MFGQVKKNESALERIKGYQGEMQIHPRNMKSADWHKFVARPEDSWIEINLTIFNFFRDKDVSQFVYDHLAIFLKHFDLYK